MRSPFSRPPVIATPRTPGTARAPRGALFDLGAPMQRKAFLWFLSLLLLIGLAPASFAFAQDDADPAEAEAEFTLNLATLATKDTPWGKQLKEYKTMVEEKSGGRIKVKLHLGGRKGDEKSMVRQLSRGTIQGFGGSTGAMAEEVPEMGIFELPFLFKDTKQADTIIDDIIAPEMAEILKEKGFVLYIMAENGFRNFATKDIEIHGPDDLKKPKMRSQEFWVHEEMYRALGGNPVALPVSEVTTSLTTGNIDGFDNTPLYAFAAGWNKLITVWNVSDHIYQPAIIVYNKEWYDALPPDMQAVVMADQKIQTKMGRKLVRNMNEDLVKQLETDGVKVYKLTDAEKKSLADKSKSVYDQVPKKIGERGAALLKKVMDAR
jgi:TRAP-type C4-dicarboxylate transport system substrate-binding protein